MADSTQTVDPEVMTAGTVFPSRRTITISDKAAWLAWGVLLGLGLAAAAIWYTKKRL